MGKDLVPQIPQVEVIIAGTDDKLAEVYSTAMNGVLSSTRFIRSNSVLDLQRLLRTGDPNVHRVLVADFQLDEGNTTTVLRQMSAHQIPTVPTIIITKEDINPAQKARYKLTFPQVEMIQSQSEFSIDYLKKSYKEILESEGKTEY